MAHQHSYAQKHQQLTALRQSRMGIFIVIRVGSVAIPQSAAAVWAPPLRWS